MKNRVKIVFPFLLILLLFVPSILWGQSVLEQGIALLMAGNLKEAQSLLEQALKETPDNQEIHLHLGLVYEQLSQYQKAVNVLTDGLHLGQRHKGQFYFNIANNLFALEEWTQAHDMYSRALLVNSTLSPAYLNRANLQVRLENYPEAIADYTIYLEQEQDTPQKPQIRQMIALLGSIEQEREQQRRDEERRQAEEARRQQQLLDAVLDSLDNATLDTENIKSESEDLAEVEDEFDIAD